MTSEIEYCAACHDVLNPYRSECGGEDGERHLDCEILRCDVCHGDAGEDAEVFVYKIGPRIATERKCELCMGE